MGNKKWTRALALCLAVVCTLTVVAAAGIDKNGDGKYTVWDLQALFKENKTTDYDATLRQILGGKGDELNPVNGVYEIWTELGLKTLRKHATEGCSFKLMADLDLGGMDWTPIAGFKGTFNGNDHTIKNFKIIKSTGTVNMGFFGDTENVDNEDVRTSISDLHLEDVQIVATSGAQYIGAIVGTNRGDIVNCTAVSAVTDLRTGLTKSIYYGSLAGRNATQPKKDENGDVVLGADGKALTVTLGTITGSNELNTTVNITKESSFTQDVISADYVNAKTVNSKMAVFFSEDLDYATEEAQRYTGIAGFTLSGGNISTLRWQDITNSTDLAPQVLQDRRELAAAEMYKMCTVEWTPSKEYSIVIAPSVGAEKGTGIEYYRYTGAADQFKPESQYFAGGIWVNGTWYKGGVYRGIPYNHGASNIDRFLSVMEVKNGVYTTGPDLPTTAYYITDEDAKTEINTAYENGQSTTSSGYTVPEDMTELLKAGVANNVGFNQYIGADCASQAAWAWRKISAVVNSAGWVNPQSTTQLYPMASNIDAYGLVAVNGMVLDDPGDADGDGDSNDSGDKCVYMSKYLTDNTTYWWDTLALTSKGDFLMEYSPAGGHTRVALSDAVVIRNYKGVLNADLSYIVTAEQGGSGADSDGIDRYSDVTAATPWRSSCCVDRRTTFADLTTNTKATDGYYRCWAPITCDALRNADSAAGNVTFNMDASGKITSNFQIVSTTVNGKTTYTGIGQTEPRLRATSVTVSGNVGDTVTVRLANGKDYTGVYGTAGLTEVK